MFADALDEVCALFDGQTSRGRPRGDLRADGDPEALGATAGNPARALRRRDGSVPPAGSLGVTPDLLLGHSIGELTAAHVAGVFSAEGRRRARHGACAPDAGVPVRRRDDLPPGGRGRGTPAARDGVSIVAAVNGPASTVVSGDEDAAEAIAADVVRGRQRPKRLRVSHAFHSPHMDAMLEEFPQVASGVEFTEPRLPIVSNVTGALATAGELRDPATGRSTYAGAYGSTAASRRCSARAPPVSWSSGPTPC